MFCDSCCQQFSSALSSCNFQPSSQHWYRFKKPPLHRSSHAVRSIDCLLWFSFLHYACRGKYLKNSQPLSRVCCDIFKFVDLKEQLFQCYKINSTNKSILWRTSSNLCLQHSLIHLYGFYLLLATKCEHNLLVLLNYNIWQYTTTIYLIWSHLLGLGHRFFNIITFLKLDCAGF